MCPASPSWSCLAGVGSRVWKTNLSTSPKVASLKTCLVSCHFCRESVSFNLSKAIVLFYPLGSPNSSVSSVLDSLSFVMQHCRFNPRLSRIFPLELVWVLTPFPRNSFRWEHKPRSSLCTHAFFHTDSKDLSIHVLDGWMPATKTYSTCTIHEDRMWLPLWVE